MLRAELAQLRQDAAARDARVGAKLDAIEARISAGAHPSPSSPSLANVGSTALAQLEERGAIRNASASPRPDAGAAPFASAADIERFRLCTNERQLVQAVAPLLREARGLSGAGFLVRGRWTPARASL